MKRGCMGKIGVSLDPEGQLGVCRRNVRQRVSMGAELTDGDSRPWVLLSLH